MAEQGTQSSGPGVKSGIWSRLVAGLGVVGLLALPVAALGARFGLWHFGTGFTLLNAGVVLAAIGFVLGIAVFVFAVVRRRARDRNLAVLGTVAAALVLVWMGLQYGAAVSVPPIHNISTDREDPPAFVVVAELRGEGANPLDYDAGDAQAQAAGYPELSGAVSADSAEDSFAKALVVVRSLGWEVVNEDAAQGIIEATVTTFWFGFKDDIVVRVRADGDGSRIDLRSVSRVGLSDLGANARRIEEFLARLER